MPPVQHPPRANTISPTNDIVQYLYIDGRSAAPVNFVWILWLCRIMTLSLKKPLERKYTPN
jgi:hypothetical protein